MGCTASDADEAKFANVNVKLQFRPTPGILQLGNGHIVQSETLEWAEAAADSAAEAPKNYHPKACVCCGGQKKIVSRNYHAYSFGKGYFGSAAHEDGMLQHRTAREYANPDIGPAGAPAYRRYLVSVAADTCSHLHAPCQAVTCAASARAFVLGPHK